MPGLALDRVPDPDERRIVQPGKRMRSAAAAIAPRGLRNSWANMARNSSFRRASCCVWRYSRGVHDCHGGQLRELNQDGLIPFGEVTFIFIGQCYEA